MTSTILGSLSLLILGFALFVGLKNKENYEAKIETRKELDNLNVQKTNKLDKTTKERDATQERRVAREAEAAEMGKKLDEQKEKNVELAKQIDEKKDQIAAQKLKIEQLVEALKDLGDIETLIPKVKALKNSIIQLKADIVANDEKLKNLIAEQNRTAGIVTGYESENSWRSAVTSNPKLDTRIGRIYETYGFVSLPVGNNAGVVGGSKLEVVRDGAVIAKLLVKLVEPKSSTADIIPGSLVPDTVLIEGDKVRSLANAPTPTEIPAVELPVPTPANPADDVAPAPVEEKPAAVEEKPAVEAKPEVDPFE